MPNLWMSNQHKNVETLWNLVNVPALVDLEIHSNVLGHHAKNNLIFAWTPENGPVETGVTGLVAMALTLFNEGI